MATRILAAPNRPFATARLPILTLLHPREQGRPAVLMLAGALVVGALEMSQLGWPLWGATSTVLLLLLVPGVAKWRADARRYGRVAMGLSFVLFAQGFHTIEHITQWVQYHILNLRARDSTGFLSAANSEWVHFVWNWLLMAGIVVLMVAGVRNEWSVMLLFWAFAHTMEHTYMFVRYLQVLDELRRLGVTTITAQGLPGILGVDGWLARSDLTQGTLLCHLPGLTTANRLDIHFWWNAIEFTLLACAANTYLRRVLPGPAPRIAPGDGSADSVRV
jgi:hypothetical protein